MSTPARPLPEGAMPDELDEPFWEACNRQELLLHRCDTCGRSYWPASCCVDHGGQSMTWVPASGRGVVDTYTVLSKERSVVMDSSSVGIPVDAPDGYHLTVDYAVRITSRGLFVHSAPWAVNSLGFENVSHGCISLSPEDAEWYFNTVNVGDPVIVRENNLEIPRMVSADNRSR